MEKFETSILGFKVWSMSTLEERLVHLGKCPHCKQTIETIPLAGHPEFSPRQCIGCNRIYIK